MQIKKRSGISSSLLILCGLFITLLFVHSNTYAAPTIQRSLSIVIMGDSYSAGNGAGMYYGPSGSYRSHRNWGSIYTQWLNIQGVKTTYTDVSHDGHTLKEFSEEQISKVPKNTNLVMTTIGGNDAKFGAIVERCFARGLNSSDGCESSIKFANDQLDLIIEKTTKVFNELESRLASDAQIVLVGYPLLSIPSDYSIKSCVTMKDRKCLKHTAYKPADPVRKLGKLANQKQAEFIKKWNASHKLKATFVGDIGSVFDGHEPNPSPDARNNTRWINEFFETEGREEGGKVESKISTDPKEWYHPNITGHQKIANRIIHTVGIPPSAKTITPDSSDIDIVFVVDTTGSMSGVISTAKQHVNDMVRRTRQKTHSARFALVEYQDHPSHGGAYNDYPSKVLETFTYDYMRFELSVNNLQLGNGGDYEESVHSGIMAGLDLDWRPGVRKIVMVIGDAPAKDPEPITGYTWQQVAKRAYDIDPVEIYAIDTHGGLSGETMQQLTKQSGGSIVYTDPSNVTTAMFEVIDISTNKPFGWIQGPYVIKVGESLELDARGSYAIDNNITAIDWDLDGDGIFETSSSNLLYTHTFTEEFSGTIGVRIIDGSGRTGVGSTQLDVSDDGDSIPRHLDNCPDVANQNQSDYDGDSIGDHCDDDSGWPTDDQSLDYEFSEDFSIDTDALENDEYTSYEVALNSPRENARDSNTTPRNNSTENTASQTPDTQTTKTPSWESFTAKVAHEPVQFTIYIVIGCVISATFGFIAWRSRRKTAA